MSSESRTDWWILSRCFSRFVSNLCQRSPALWTLLVYRCCIPLVLLPQLLTDQPDLAERSWILLPHLISSHSYRVTLFAIHLLFWLIQVSPQTDPVNKSESADHWLIVELAQRFQAKGKQRNKRKRAKTNTHQPQQLQQQPLLIDEATEAEMEQQLTYAANLNASCSQPADSSAQISYSSNGSMSIHDATVAGDAEVIVLDKSLLPLFAAAAFPLFLLSRLCQRDSFTSSVLLAAVRTVEMHEIFTKARVDTDNGMESHRPEDEDNSNI